MSKKHSYSPNDQRSIVMNPNNPAFWADRQNRVEQGHPVPPTAAPEPGAVAQPPRPLTGEATRDSD